MIFKLTRAGLCCICALVLCASAEGSLAAFVDPLTAPSMMSPLAERSPLVAVKETPGKRWVAVGRRGHILVSNDAKQWQQSKVPVSVDLTNLHFVDAKHGWAVGHGGAILASVDGGITWTKQFDGRQAAAAMVKFYKSALAASPGDETLVSALDDAKRFHDSGPSRPFLSVWFADATHGYAVGAYNLLFSTDDGGHTWLPHSHRIANPRGLHLNEIRAIGNDVFIAGEQGLLARLNPDTQHFDAIDSPYQGTLVGLTGNEKILVVFGLQGNAYLTHDRGKTWRKLDVGIDDTIVAGMMLDDGRIALSGIKGQLAVGTPDSDRFKLVKLSRPMSIYDLAAGPGNSIVLVGERGIRTEPLAQ